jgi:hypothetical protein
MIVVRDIEKASSSETANFIEAPFAHRKEWRSGEMMPACVSARKHLSTGG